MQRTLFVLGATVVLLAGAALFWLGGEERVEHGITQTTGTDGSTCHENENFFVVVKERGEEVGSDFLVKRKTGAGEFACEYAVAEGDFEIQDEMAAYFLALEGDTLILDSGTAPEPRGLIVYDLMRRERAFEDRYARPITVENNRIDYWAEAGVPPTVEACPDMEAWEAQGLRASMEVRATLDLATLVKTTTEETRCAVRQ